MKRAFYRCVMCCHVVAIEQVKSMAMPDLHCVCDGSMALMGFVGPKNDRLVLTEDRCPCDERCTHARGPNCDCSCGGKNHGTHAVVEVVVDAGDKPKIVIEHSAELKARAAEYHALRAPLVAERDALRELRQERRWLDGPDYTRLADVERRLAYAHNLKTHKSRVKALAEG